MMTLEQQIDELNVRTHCCLLDAHTAYRDTLAHGWQVLLLAWLRSMLPQDVCESVRQHSQGLLLRGVAAHVFLAAVCQV